VSKVFDCKAIDHALTFQANGKITPCCVIHDYGKNINTISNPSRFSDLKISGTPASCIHCVSAGEHSYKHSFDRYHDGFKQLDIRNSNICNLKCRTCGPDFSSKWADELGITVPVKKTDIDQYIDKVLNSSVKYIYFAGGEPMLNPDHWNLLDRLIETNLAADIGLQYSTNCTTVKYKNKNIFDYWQKFQNVVVLASVDATGRAFECIRSDARWNIVDQNIRKFLDLKSDNVTVEINMVLSILSVWFLPDVLKYAQGLQIKVNIFQLTHPEHYSLSVLPSNLADLCLRVLTESIQLSPDHNSVLTMAKETINKNERAELFKQTVSDILSMDQKRNENLFDLLPFNNYVM